SGSFINEEDVNSYAPVIVLGPTVVTSLFPAGDVPVSGYVPVRNPPVEVIGGLPAEGANASGNAQENGTLVPSSAGNTHLFGIRPYLNSIRVQVAEGGDAARLDERITQLVETRHGARDFRVRNTASIMETAAATQNTLTIPLGSVAAISLLVG